MMANKKLWGFISVLILFAALWWTWDKYAAPTRIAMINFPNFQTAAIASSSHTRFIKVDVVGVEELQKLDSYDAVLIFGMGFRMDEAQKEQLIAFSEKKIPVFTFHTTNPDYNINNQDSVITEKVNLFMRYGTGKNYASLLSYIRSELDAKTIFTPAWEEPFTVPDNYYYHVEDDIFFESLEAFEEYRSEHGLVKPGAKKIALTGGIAGGRNRGHIVSMIEKFEADGYNVYPIAGHTQRLDFLKQVMPDAVIYMPHGRLTFRGEEGVEWLKSMNIPIFAPLTILETEDQWKKNPMGMSGGFMSQSVVMPELDGAILPYAVNAEYINEEGLHLFKAVPERLETFARIVGNYITLKELDNSQKRIAIYYYKGAGLSSLTASGLEVVPSLYNTLLALKNAGYDVQNLPSALDQFNELIMTQGVVLGTYAKGAYEEYLKNGKPELVAKEDYLSWVQNTLPAELYQAVEETHGPAPGSYMSVYEQDKEYLAVARVQFGNVVLLPQPMAGIGDDAFALVHGAKTAPPHSYISSYLWVQHGFGAHAIMHFGTHGSLEFTPGKQVALSHNDWSDRLIGHLPHFYYYTINNVSEGTIAKRRSYANLITYLTPPFMEGDMRGQVQEFAEKMRAWYNLDGDAKYEQALKVKQTAIEMGLHRDLRLDDDITKPYTDEEMLRLDNFAEELTIEKITGQFYTTGQRYEDDKIVSTVVAMSADPIAYALASIDKQKGKITQSDLENKSFFSSRYLLPSQKLVLEILNGSRQVHPGLMMQISGLDQNTIMGAIGAEKKHSENPRASGSRSHPQGQTSTPATGGHPHGQVNAQAGGHPNTSERSGNAANPHGSTGAHPHAAPATTDSISPQDIALRESIKQLHEALSNIINYRKALISSPDDEINTILNAFAGGYISPSPGGDPVANPNALPTGRNLFSINAEATPSASAWDIGVALANATIEEYRKRNEGKYPRKVSYTLWGGEFIQTEGATLAQVLYMLGVEPIRDRMGRISDIRLIPSEELGRPRIDVLAQTSGQLRDIAASRLFLINKAVTLAAGAQDDVHPNFVNEGVIEAERIMVDEGIPPAQARKLSYSRVFGGMNGMYGTGIMGMVESGDRWEDESEIARTYLNNMGAMYSSEDEWGGYQQGVLKAVLHNADAVVQPRQSNAWGPLSLDHVYEFMGGLNLTIRNVTGKEPEAFFSDYRNRHDPRVQEVKEAIAVEARTTLLNPAFIKERMKGQGTAADEFAEIFRNTYGFNVMKPNAVDDELWDGLHEIYVQDKMNLEVHDFFERESPAALQEMTAVMMETARKGYWEATPEQLAELANLHTCLVNEHKAACTGFVCDNLKLREFIAQNASPENVSLYNQQIENVRQASAAEPLEGTVMRKETIRGENDTQTTLINGLIIVIAALVVLGGIVYLIRKRRKQNLSEE
jgi:cobaltochelatase CobN